MTERKQQQPKCSIEFSGPPDFDCFIVLDGKRIAKRENETWIPLEPGYVVRQIGDLEIEVEFNGVRVH
jgi:hypothetical protein